jgi:hypothetical protein
MQTAMHKEPLRAAQGLAQALTARLPRPFTLLLYGSAVLGDYRPGWSDIDVLAVCDCPLPQALAETLVMLRQDMVQHSGDAAFRRIEGVIMSMAGLLQGSAEPVVYWGTGGQRLILTGFTEDPFSRKILREKARVIAGDDIRARIPEASQQELRNAVAHHLRTIRNHARITGESLYSAGWMLDIARCLYTLHTGDVIAKTAAGHWALQEGLCPCPDLLRLCLQLRENPMLYDQHGYDRTWLSRLGPEIQRFADVLEASLQRM